MLTAPDSSREFYKRLHEISASLAAAGCTAAATRLHFLLHHAHFTTGNEAYFEFEQAIKEILLGKFELVIPVDIRKELLFYLDWMDTLDYPSY